MGGSSLAKEYPYEYLAGAAIAAAINYPLWRASAIGQSGFRVGTVSVGGIGVPPSLSPYLYAFSPPYKGLGPVVLGMTWARGFIFWGSDRGKDLLQSNGVKNETLATLVPPLVTSVFVQFVNQPIVRSSITLQDPQFNCPDTASAIRQIARTHGVGGLYHGLTAGILKTVPKYVTAIVTKDCMEEWLDAVDPSSPTAKTDRLWRSTIKSATAGVAGAALTNPLDVVRNEMFKKNKSLIQTICNLYNELGYKFLFRGCGQNMIAVAIPVTCTIFFTDALIEISRERDQEFKLQN